MLCHLARKAISGSEDRGQALPRWAGRHIGRCEACRDHARFAASLKARLADDRSAFLAAAPEFPLKKAAWDKAGTERQERVSLGRRLVLHPFPAAAGVLALAAAAFLVFRTVPRAPMPSAEDRAAARAAFESIVAAPDGFRGAFTEAESSLEKEKRIWESSVVSAVEYLQARLNIRIERRDEPRPF
ncbi:MAG: hypothetical protein M0C28_32420 [Candidatus Moduliflexus flocculans]|nr:hypothetical protein [Candidatus Moduliflexus flocculans]